VGKHEAGYARVIRDHYPTRERWVTEALLAHVDLTGLRIWEPATGAGDIAEVLKASGAARVHCSDIADYGYPLDEVRDFTVTTAAATAATRFDAIITNPPQGRRNSLAESFIAAGLHHIMYGGLLALLLPADFDSAARRRPLFAECAWFTAKIVLTRRIVWFERTDGVRAAPKENHCWFIWQRTPLRERAAPRVLYAPDKGDLNAYPAR
jgi:hypothetical protein